MKSIIFRTSDSNMHINNSCNLHGILIKLTINVSKQFFRILISLIFFFVGISAYSQNTTCGSFIGDWRTPDNDIIRIYQSSGKYWGKLIKIGEPLDEKGKPWKDERNPDKSLQNRELKGIIILKNLVCESSQDNFIKGKVYLPEEGSTLTCSLYMLDANTLKIKVTIGIFSDSEKWTKIK